MTRPITAAEPAANQYEKQHQPLDDCLQGGRRDQSLAALRQYFNDAGEPETLYTGRRFERFGGSGDSPDDPNRFTAADVLSLTFLSISDRLPNIALATMEVHADRISTLLAKIPANIAMPEAPWELLAPNSPAAQLWNLLRTCAGKYRWVTANKLLARKRPHLLPCGARRRVCQREHPDHQDSDPGHPARTPSRNAG
jgi:hypothetical protein